MANASECLRLCAADGLCDSWVWQATAASARSCRLCRGVPLGVWSGSYVGAGSPAGAVVADQISGVSGAWAASHDALTFNTRSDGAPQSGNATLRWIGAADGRVSFAVGQSAAEVYSRWTDCRMSSAERGDGPSVHGSAGATALKTTLAARETRTLSVALSWFYPNRDFNHFRLGNAYAND